MRINRVCVIVLFCALVGAMAGAQGRNLGFEWPATNADAQRTGWMRLDPSISPATMNSPEFRLQWKETLDNAPRQSLSLSQGVTMNGLLVFSPASFVTGVSNVVFTLDNDTGFPLWTRRFSATIPTPTAQCPGGMTGASARVTTALPGELQISGEGGPRDGYRGGIGAPGEGVPMAIARRDGGAALRGEPAPAGRGGGGVGALFGGKYAGPVYAVPSTGMLHSLGQNSGIDVERPVPFLPANSRYSDLIGIDETLYTSTSQGCGGAANGVWAISIAANSPRTVTSWRTNGGNPVGNIAFTTDGKLLLAVGAGQAASGGFANAVVALDAKTLQPTDWFTAANADFVTTPVVFSASGREIVAAATRDGRILLLDARSLGGVDHATPLYASQPLSGNFSPEALATWESQGTRWLLVPNNGIVAYRTVNQGGRLSLEPGWTSRSLAAPTAPIVVNGVVFAAASGRPNGTATLYAFDGRDGRDVWNSGSAITSYLPANTLWASNSQVHAAAYDGTVYAFGFTLERKAK